MADFFSRRFGKNVWITRHARKSMQKREIDNATLERVIEEGEIKRKNDAEMWVFMRIEGRADNLICAAVVESTAVAVETVMINWELEGEV